MNILKLFISNKGFSTPILLSIVVLSVIIAGSLFLFLQYQQTDETNKRTDIKSTEQTEKQKEIVKDKIAETKIVKVSFDTAISSTKYFPTSDQWNSYSDTDKLFFTEIDVESKLIKVINAEELIKDLRKYSEKASPTAVILGRAISAPKEVFYFFATTRDLCEDNIWDYCDWSFYKFDSRTQQFYISKDKIFGSLGKYYISPDEKNIAVFTAITTDRGSCSLNKHITVINLNDIEFQKIDFGHKEYSVNDIKSFEWTNDDIIKFSVIQFNCIESSQIKNEWHREFKYHLSSQKMELIQEKNISLSGEITKDEIIDDEIADWETYRNEEYGFEIKYPSILEYKKGSYPKYPLDWEQPKRAKLFLLFGEPNSTTGETVKIWIDSSSYLKDNYHKYYGDEGCFQTFLSNKEAQRCEMGPSPLEAIPEGYIALPDMPMIEFRCIEVKNKGNFYFLSVQGIVPMMMNRFEIFEKMLSSFQFLE